MKKKKNEWENDARKEYLSREDYCIMPSSIQSLPLRYDECYIPDANINHHKTATPKQKKNILRKILVHFIIIFIAIIELAILFGIIAGLTLLKVDTTIIGSLLGISYAMSLFLWMPDFSLWLRKKLLI